MAVAAIDQGTTSTRALVVDDNGECRILRCMAHRQFYPKPGWVEHDPEELIHHIQGCVDACAETSSSSTLGTAGNIAAIGLANQGESCLAWHADTKQTLSPVIVWQDSRTGEIIEKLRRRGAQALVAEKSGLPLSAYFSAAKLGWIVANIPAANALHKRGKLRLGTTDAFFLDRLTGRFVTDITTASRTSLLNLRSGQWDGELCDLFGVPMQALPRIVASTGEFGSFKSHGHQAIPVTASIVDQQAALYGHGCRTPGDAKITFGTGAFALALTGEQPLRPPGLTPTVAWQFFDRAPHYALEGGVHCAGAAINWGKSLGLFQKFSQINQFSAPAAVGRGIVFVPALSGLAAPHWDPKASGLWIGLSLDTQSMDLMQSMLEGIAFRATEVINAIHTVSPLGDTVSIDGGVSSNPYFCQFLANALGRQVVVKKFSELTAFGTAWLAALGAAHPFAEAAAWPQKQYVQTENIAHHADQFKQAIARAAQWLP